MPDRRRPTDNDNPGLEATELERLRSRYSHTQATSIRHPDGHNFSTDSQRLTLINRLFTAVIEPAKKFWKNQVSVIVPHDDCRDHLALERTFMSYLRTSLVASALGVTVAQLFRLQHVASPNTSFGFFVLGKPLACICQGAAIYCLCLGAYRSWRLQNAIIRGKAISGGFEIVLLGGGVLLIVVLFFVLLIAVDIMKEDIH